MMNIYDFINSKDIRQHCKKLEHTFNLKESAYLIYQSLNHTLPEKHTAWKELIEAMPDMIIEKGYLSGPRYYSLHEMLRRYMALEDRMLADFFKEEADCVYRFDRLYRIEYWGDDTHSEYQDGKCAYQSFAYGLSAEKEELAEDEDLEHLLHFRITKMRICSDTQKEAWELTVRVDENGTPLEIFGDTNVLSKEESDLHGAFDEMWIDVPTPFQKGDLVFANHQKLGFISDPFVLDTLCTDKATEEERKRVESSLKYSDASDMIAYGYQLWYPLKIWYECDHDYLSLEYYDWELTEEKRILKVIQAFIQGKIDLGMCVEAYHYILLEEYLKSHESWKRDMAWRGVVL